MDLDLPKGAAELFGFENLLAQGTKCSFYRHCEKDLIPFFERNDDYCVDAEGLLGAAGCEHDAVEWRLFTDSLKASRKWVLLHNGNYFAFMPIGP